MKGMACPDCERLAAEREQTQRDYDRAKELWERHGQSNPSTPPELREGQRRAARVLQCFQELKQNCAVNRAQ